MANGIDCTVQITDALAKALKAAGISFVCRYFADPKYSYKCLKPDEAKVISANQLWIATVYEDAADDMRYGYSRGVSDARNYLAMAKACGQPEGTAAYFAADFDASGKDFGLIEQYLKGAKSILPQFIVRPYGEYDVIEEMVKRGVCDGGWQTYAWSNGKVSKYAFIYQHKNGVNVAGIPCDLDESFGNEGWWNTLISTEDANKVIGLLGEAYKQGVTKITLPNGSVINVNQDEIHRLANVQRKASGQPIQ